MPGRDFRRPAGNLTLVLTKLTQAGSYSGDAYEQARVVLSVIELPDVRVLLVEDSSEMQRLASSELSGTDKPLFQVAKASQLSEAVSELREVRTDVVLLSMPNSGGLKDLRALCQGFPKQPIVVLTESDDQELALQALREGAQDVLVKGRTEPVSLKRALLHAVERQRVSVALNTHREGLREAQRLETLGRLAGKIAHDFNNILTTIVGFSDLLIEDLQGQSCVDDVLEIKKAGERGAALTSSILSFSRREPANLDAVSAEKIIQGVSGSLRQLLPESITLQLDLPPGQPEILADPSQVEQALGNLMVNARDALPNGGWVKVTAQQAKVTADPPVPSHLPGPGEYLAVTVADNGCGMDSKTLKRVLDPFFTTKPRGTGMGLGLSTVISIMRCCGGGIEVRSEPGSGASIILYFPIYATWPGKVERRIPEYVAASGLEMLSDLEQRH